MTPVQINALRLAASIPSSLKTGCADKRTIRKLLSDGLIESGGVSSIGEGYSSESFLITDKGRAALGEQAKG